MLRFDLNQIPPTAKEIAEARQSAESAAKRRYRLVALLLISSVTTLAFAGVFALVTDGGNTAGIKEYVAVLGLVAIAFIAPSLVGSGNGGNPKHHSSHWGALADIALSDCQQFLTDCLADPLCEEYRRKVAALGRKPVAAEVEMIRGRVANVVEQKKMFRAEIACSLVVSQEPLTWDIVEQALVPLPIVEKISLQ
jgi:hypothetical protein